MNILILDHYDSFTMNLAHLLAKIVGCMPVIHAHDDPLLTLELIDAFDCIILSPGPGQPAHPEDFAFSRSVLAHYTKPLLGVCLGFQGLCLHEGASIVRVPPAHGRLSAIHHDHSLLFNGLPDPWPVVRYHSLAVEQLPDSLQAHAYTTEGILMAVSHRHLPRWGVQFHPESIATVNGERLLQNFLHVGRHQSLASPAQLNIIPAPSLPVAASRPPLCLRHQQIPLPQPAASIFQRLYSQSSTAFWLDSPAGTGQAQRFSIMGDASGPFCLSVRYEQATRTLWQCRLQDSSVPEQQQQLPPHTSFLEWMDQQSPVLHLSDTQKCTLTCDFYLGWVGYLGYEMHQEIVASANTPPPEMVMAMPSAAPDAQWIWCDRALIIDHECQTLDILWAEDPQQPDHRWAQEVSQRLHDLPALPEHPPLVPPPLLHHLRLRHDQAHYLQLIQQAQDTLRAGDSYELCLTNQILAECNADPLCLYLQLRQLTGVPYAAYLRFADTHLLCASPEQFIRRQCNGRLSSSPIKGTRPRHPDPLQDQHLAQELSLSLKDRAENLMIVDLVRHDLGHCCIPGSIQVPQLQTVQSFPHVHQMISRIEGQSIPGLSPWKILGHLFPGGSMTGAPKRRSIERLHQLESSPRGIYSGCLGYISSQGCMNLNIIIRTLIVHQQSLSYGIGGAITIDSDPHAEFQETLVKAKPFLRLFALEPAAIAGVAHGCP